MVPSLHDNQSCRFRWNRHDQCLLGLQLQRITLTALVPEVVEDAEVNSERETVRAGVSAWPGEYVI